MFLKICKYSRLSPVRKRNNGHLRILCIQHIIDVLVLIYYLYSQVFTSSATSTTYCGSSCRTAASCTGSCGSTDRRWGSWKVSNVIVAVVCCLTAYLHHMNLFETITQAMRPNLTRSCWETCTTSTTITGTCGSCSSCSPSAPGWRRPSASSRYSTRSSWDRWNVLLNISLLMQKFREGLIPHITLADRKGNGVLVVKWQVIFLF